MEKNNLLLKTKYFTIYIVFFIFVLTIIILILFIIFKIYINEPLNVMKNRESFHLLKHKDLYNIKFPEDQFQPGFFYFKL